MNVTDLFLTSQPDWIKIDRGDLVQVEKALREYAKLSHSQTRTSYEAVISSHNAGFIFVAFSKPLPTYLFINLLGWLADPPEIADVSGARGWFRVPGSKERFALYPDHANPWGDTLLGYSTTGRKIEVYQPEASICETTKEINFFAEPSIDPNQVKESARLALLFDTDLSFTNPAFEITHSPDTNWNQ